MTLPPSVLLFLAGGACASVAVAQPCGNPWSLSPATGPTARRNHAVSYDSGRGKVVLFGGLASGLPVGDTWEWTAAGPGGGGSWLLRSSTGPAARDRCGLAYDAVRQKTVLFGGSTGTTFNNQTWEWDGVAWTLALPAASPPAMDGSLMAFDPVRQRIVLVSSLFPNAGGSRTWQYDGITWTQFTQSTPAPVPSYSSLAFDTSRSRMVLLSLVSSGYLSSAVQVWERDANGWLGREYGTFPISGTGTAAAFDPVRNQVVVVDNQASNGKTSIWNWNGTAWTVVSSDGPAVAEGRSPVFDVAGGQLLLFGGRPTGSSTDLDQTWLCRSDSRSGPVLSNLGKRSFFLRLGGPIGTFPVTGTGTGTITYQWRLNQVELIEGGPFTGVNTPILSVNPTDINYGGNYDTVVTDSCGTTIRPATRVTLTCYPNCDGSTAAPVLNAEDFNCFLNKYAAGCLEPEGCYANCDGGTMPPTLNANDFGCFLNAYAAGCP